MTHCNVTLKIPLFGNKNCNANKTEIVDFNVLRTCQKIQLARPPAC